MTELKSCPFCDCTHIMTWHIGIYLKPWVAKCCKCEAEGPHATTESEAMEKWNKRVIR